MHRNSGNMLLAGASFLFLTGALAAAEAPKVTFLRDVAPILNKVGCTSGPCHGAAKGKNGFKLSLRGYDPQFDYEALLYDLSGRRFNRADPASSLMLAKPTQQVPHGGGLRFDIGSGYYQTIFNWIAQGVPFGDPAADTVRRLEAEPAEFFFKAPEEAAAVKVTAVYADGGTRDVSREAIVESNVPDVAAVANVAGNAPSVKGARVGEATLLVRYQGNLTTVPVTVLNPKPGFAWKQLPQNNYIDKAIDAKLQKLKIQPSDVVSDAGFLRRVSLDLAGQLPTPEAVSAFLADTSKTKRSAIIDKLIASPAYVDHWTLKWGDLLQNNRKYLGEKGAYEFREWIRDAIAQNKRMSPNFDDGLKCQLVLDAVMDSGVMQEFLLRRLAESGPRSLRLAVLLDKPSRRRVALEPDYFGFQTASKEVWVGYGLADAAGRRRNEPSLSPGGKSASNNRKSL